MAGQKVAAAVVCNVGIRRGTPSDCSSLFVYRSFRYTYCTYVRTYVPCILTEST